MNLLLLLLVLLLPWEALAQTQPQTFRVGPNLAPNPTFAGSTSWLPSGGAVYDAAVSRTADGSGSIRIPSGRLDVNPRVNVIPGRTYTFAAYIRTTAFPPALVGMIVGEHNAAGVNTANPQSGAVGNSAPNAWQEIIMTYTAESTAATALLLIYTVTPNSGAAPIWVDEMYFGEGVGFGSPPTAKVPFEGTDVRVDDLGNMQVKKSGVFQNFFPFCIYSDNRRASNGYPLYSAQGFNCDVWGGTEALDIAAAATSAFNPDGLMTGIGYTVQHTMNEGGAYYDAAGTNIAAFGTALRNHARFHTHFLWYYWDNENVYDQWNQQMTASNQWKVQDTVGSQRTHPFYGLQGSYNNARPYHNPANGQTCCDMAGTYTDVGFTGGAGHAGGQAVIWNQEGQTFPVVMEQANIVHNFAGAGLLRSTIYHYLAGGAKGFGFWRDCAPNDCGGDANDITGVPWWPDVPNIRRELDAMLPMLRQPHWTTWTAAHNSSAATLTVGTRDYLGKGHILVVNKTASPVTVAFTVTGLPYTPLSVVNFFTGAAVTTVSGNSFTLTLPANGINSGTAVVRLEGTVSTVPVITSALSASGTVGSAFSYQITASNSPTSFGASPLPGGLTINTSTGLISGTPTTTGTFAVTISATNATGTGSASLSLSLSAPPLTFQLLLHWPLNEQAGGTAADITGHGYLGTLIGGPTWKPGLLFDGATQYVQNTTLPWPVSQPITVALWVYTAGGTPGGAFNIGGSTHRIGAHIPYSDNMLYWDYGPGFPAARIVTNFSAYLNKWTHVALVSNGTNFKAIYLNGQLITSDTVAGAPSIALTGAEVGRYNVGGAMAWYAGRIRDFRLFTYVLPAPDILALYYATGRRPSIRRSWQ